jgi:YfiH family protein
MRAMLLCHPVFDQVPRLRHAFFTREGGVSEGLFGSLNCGLRSGDDPRKVAENRARAAAALGLAADRLVTLRQVHSARVLAVSAPFGGGPAPEADGLATATPGLALGILTADCAPVLLADRAAGVIGAAHAGWKGALGGVLEAAIAAMEGLGARRHGIVAAIGPCIGSDSYEVGPEFRQRFVAAAESNAGFFRALDGTGKHYFDLPGYVASRLRAAGVYAVEALPHDTCAEEDRFFSYRRAFLRKEPVFGNGLSAICLEGPA